MGNIIIHGSKILVSRMNISNQRLWFHSLLVYCSSSTNHLSLIRTR